MTRNTWLTVRLPGASTAPATSTRMWFQTGAVKHGRKTASQVARMAGTWQVAGMDSLRSCVIGVLESQRTARARVAGYVAYGHQRPAAQVESLIVGNND